MEPRSERDQLVAGCASRVGWPPRWDGTLLARRSCLVRSCSGADTGHHNTGGRRKKKERNESRAVAVSERGFAKTKYTECFACHFIHTSYRLSAKEPPIVKRAAGAGGGII